MKEDLKEFLEEWLKCAEKGRGDFDNEHGLCYNLESWFLEKKRYEGNDFVPVRTLFESLLEDYVRAVGEDCNSAYPFGGGMLYAKEQRKAAMHLNPERRAWVIRTIARLEEENDQIF